MGVFSFLGKAIAKPYTRISKDIGRSSMKIRGGVDQIKGAINKDVSHHVDYVQTDSSTEAFELIYKKNNWTEQELSVHLLTIRRAKWVSLVSLWTTLCGYVGLWIYGQGTMVIFFGNVFAALMVANFTARALKWSLQQAQVEQRDLLSLKEFWALPNRWGRIFS